MNVTTSSFIPYIEAAFSGPLSRYGFNLAERRSLGAPYHFDLVRYDNDGRTVQVSYEHARDAYCDVVIGGRGCFFPLKNLFEFTNSKPTWARDADSFAEDARRCSELLIQYCDDFLRGDIKAFRLKYSDVFLRP